MRTASSTESQPSPAVLPETTAIGAITVIPISNGPKPTYAMPYSDRVPDLSFGSTIFSSAIPVETAAVAQPQPNSARSNQVSPKNSAGNHSRKKTQKMVPSTNMMDSGTQ